MYLGFGLKINKLCFFPDFFLTKPTTGSSHFEEKGEGHLVATSFISEWVTEPACIALTPVDIATWLLLAQVGAPQVSWS